MTSIRSLMADKHFLNRMLIVTAKRGYNNFGFSSATGQQSGSSNFTPQVYKICLTGGPCAGKTTALTYL